MPERSKYFILVDGHPSPCDSLTWGRWLQEHPEESIIQETQLDGTRVVTIFLGYDHNWSGGHSLLFETTFFGGAFDGEQYRHETRADAVAFHEMACARLREGRIEFS